MWRSHCGCYFATFKVYIKVCYICGPFSELYLVVLTFLQWLLFIFYCTFTLRDIFMLQCVESVHHISGHIRLCVIILFKWGCIWKGGGFLSWFYFSYFFTDSLEMLLVIQPGWLVISQGYIWAHDPHVSVLEIQV